MTVKENISGAFLERSSALNSKKWQVSLMTWMVKWRDDKNGVSDSKVELLDQLPWSLTDFWMLQKWASVIL